ncbi:MAG: RNA-directed DNA polymerase [Clostridia bacterium]
MCKSIKTKFEDKLSFEKLLAAHERARKGKTNKNEVIKFEMNLEANIINLEKKLRDGTYRCGTYKSFTIYEPKERIIKSLPYIDRVVHQWYVEEFIKPFYNSRLIRHTYACIENRGTHACVKQMQQFMREAKRNYGNEYYILKMDIRKFFYNIKPSILYSILDKRITNVRLKEFTKSIIYSNIEIDDIGIPIGNYTSQYFANIYMNELDQFVKNNLNVKYYIRYMDDFILLLRSKEECRDMLKKITIFLEIKLELELNKKTKYYPNRMGTDFCGYVIYDTHIRIRKNSKIKIKRNIRKWNKLYHKTRLDFSEILRMLASLHSWEGHAKHADTFILRKQILEKCDFIYDPLLDYSIDSQGQVL